VEEFEVVLEDLEVGVAVAGWGCPEDVVVVGEVGEEYA